MYEFIGPGLNKDDRAKYRATRETINLNDLKVPLKLEVLNQQGRWQQHPVVLRIGSNLNVFLDGGEIISFDCNISTSYCTLLEEKAKELGLIKGSRSLIMLFY